MRNSEVLFEEDIFPVTVFFSSYNNYLSADTAKSVSLSWGAADVLENCFSLFFSFAGELPFISQDLAVIDPWKEGLTFE